MRCHQADGGTRTAAITGACVALVDAINHLQRQKLITQDPLIQMVASVSVGVFQGVPVLDLDYPEDSAADTDMNVVMGESGGFIEVQGTAEGAPFARQQLDGMLDLAAQGITGVDCQGRKPHWPATPERCAASVAAAAGLQLDIVVHYDRRVRRELLPV